MSLAVKRRLLKNKLTRCRKLTQMYEQLFPTCAERVWAIRNVLEMNQGEFGEHCGLTGGWVSRIECGYGLPKGSTLTKVVEATGLSADFILGTDAKVDPKVIHKTERFIDKAEQEMRHDSAASRKRERDTDAAAGRLLARSG